MASCPNSAFEKQKLKGSRAAGIRYEKNVGKRIQREIKNKELNLILKSSQWFAYEDINGRGYCQTDHILFCQGFILLLECKLTQTEYAFDQMKKLYVPVLQEIYNVPIIPVQVCRNLRRQPIHFLPNIWELVNRPVQADWTWHWTI